ncbi:type IV pilin protein [Alteromonas sp. ASW11-130]|uniref:type IV pilin protein n=1 Tax=Alteromonas sp. ASW11-130 TaxID=3015775 RepID=UPI002241FF1E|nr:prepilin-type N-terminal cleavage/methylation domain-containing protein [Alteromonas sp. ASW11-130]
MKKNQQTGYSLIETVVVMAITAILAGVAVPSYQTYWERNNIRQVQLQLVALQTLQERFRLINGTYASGEELNVSEIKGFKVSATNVGDFTYTLVAESENNKGVRCSKLTIDHASQRTPAHCWD